MGYQESIIYTSKADVERNNRDIRNIIEIFKKYDVRCSGDDTGTCIGYYHLEEQIFDYAKGLDMLAVVGDRSCQKDCYRLFDIGRWKSRSNPSYTDEEKELIERTKIQYINDDALWIEEAQIMGICNLIEVNLLPKFPPNFSEMEALSKEILGVLPNQKENPIKDDEDVIKIADAIGKIVTEHGFNFHSEEEDECDGEIKSYVNFYLNEHKIGSIGYIPWKHRYCVNMFDLCNGKRLRMLANALNKA